MMSTLDRSPRLRLGLLTLLAVAVAAAVAVPLALANTATPTRSIAKWQYVNGNSGAIRVVVRGPWNWVSQSCAQGGKSGAVSHTDINGHYAIGFAGSWNDSTTPNTLTGKATNGTPVTLHVGNKMDEWLVDYCRHATASKPTPTGWYRVVHTYPSLAAFENDVPNGHVCVNAYDIHKAGATSDANPGKNGDNTLQANQFIAAESCATAQPANPKPDLSLVKLEHVGSAGSYERGPVTGNVGDTVYYKMVVVNTGNESLVVTLSDPRCDAGTLSDTGTVTLAPGDTATYTCSHVLTSSDVPKFVNVATASGKSANASASASSGVLAKSKVVARVVAVKGAVKAVRHRAKPAKPVVKSASFTG